MDFFLNLLSKINLETFKDFFSSQYAWIALAVWYMFLALIMISWMSFMAIVGTYAERRIAGFIQCRYGPNRVGFFGLFQPFADGIKLLFKENLIPKGAHKLFHLMAPIIVFTGALFPFVVLPFSETLKASSMNLAVLYILAFAAIEVIGILMAGFASNSKWSLIGGIRVVSQVLAYEIPLGLSALAVVLMAGTMDFSKLSLWQSENGIFSWTVFKSPFLFIAFFIFFICGLASAKRAPFDLPEAESELTAGFHTEYSAMRFAYFFMAEYASMYVVSAFCVMLFLGGWSGPIPRFDFINNLDLASIKDMFFSSNTAKDFFVNLFSKNNFLFLLRESIGVFNIILKTFFLYFSMIWIRWTFPRLRVDQFTYLCLKVLLPTSLICLIGVMLQMVIF